MAVFLRVAQQIRVRYAVNQGQTVPTRAMGVRILPETVSQQQLHILIMQSRGGVWTPASATPQFSQDLPKTMDGAIPVHQVFTKLFRLLVAVNSVQQESTLTSLLLLFVTHAPEDSTTMLLDEVPVLFVLLVVSVTNRHKRR